MVAAIIYIHLYIVFFYIDFLIVDTLDSVGILLLLAAAIIHLKQRFSVSLEKHIPFVFTGAMQHLDFKVDLRL